MLSPYSDTPFVIRLSFNPVIDDLDKVALNDSGERSLEAKALLKEIALHPELKVGITTMAQVEENAGLIKRLLHDYFPPVLGKNEIKGVSIPYRKLIFNHTERFKNILKAAGDDFDITIRDFDEHQFYVLSCCLILNEFYGTQLDFSKPLFYDIPDAKGIIKHYRILYNADYLEILPTEKSVPISQDDIDLLMNSYDNLELWKEKFPLESWTLTGFSIMTLFDATVENAVSIFKEKLLVLNADGFEESVESIFRSIYRIPDIRVGFTVFNPEEGKFSMAGFGHKMKSFILPEENHNSGMEVLCFQSFESLIEEKVYFTVSDIHDFREQNPESQLAAHLFNQGIGSFILAPVVKNNVLLGILELVSPRTKELNSINANKLEIVMPFLTDSIDRLIAEIQNRVQAFIQEKYTTIHTSVYWKFKEKARRFISSSEHGKDAELEEIVFSKVFPLYGQVDIKGSSEARNSSIQNDLSNQVKGLLSVLQSIDDASFDEEIRQLGSFETDLLLPLRTNTEQLIESYIQIWIHGRLKTITDPALRPVIDQYLLENNKNTGNFHLYRRKYETSISTINEEIAAIIDQRQKEAQLIFPHYYERFKTDGVEHNLYIGASIAPGWEFELSRLYDLRMWQIKVLCEMERTHYELKSSLPYSLDVTTLILVYNTTLAIRFRMDEKRFDVDGSYNARFEIVKKRIDKAFIKDTQERITQTGKITIVYSNDAEELEYIQYVKTLQSDMVLGETIEIFEVEDLQGVSGLKALRVQILEKPHSYKTVDE